jgi:hypothetical protein
MDNLNFNLNLSAIADICGVFGFLMALGLGFWVIGFLAAFAIGVAVRPRLDSILRRLASTIND